MAYVPAVDLMIQLGFTPSDNDMYKYPLHEGYLSAWFGPVSQMLILSDNFEEEDAWTGRKKTEKRHIWMDTVESFIHMIELFVDSGWTYPDRFDNEEEYVGWLFEHGYITEDDLL